MLGDLPGVTSLHINQIIKGHFDNKSLRNTITVPTFQGQPGNPVIWGDAFFPDLGELEGDAGGRVLFSHHPAAMNMVEIDDDCIISDTNTPEALKKWLERKKIG